MSSIKTSAMAVAVALLYATDAHMIMGKPVPYGKATLDNSPLDQSGSNFPCKQRPGVYLDGGARAANQFEVGAKNPLTFIGSAVHGGGSCQISLTKDKEPTKDTKWATILSIEGGCPGVDGGPKDFTFSIPESVAPDDYTLAWTWFNKIGNREMYMNCAPITVKGSKAKRDDNATAVSDDSIFDKRATGSLPAMFQANNGNGCKTVDSADLAFPDPGEVVQKAGAGTLAPPTGTCPAAQKVSLGGSGGSSPSPPDSPPASSKSTAAAAPNGTAPGTATILASPAPAAGTSGASPSAGGSAASPSASPSAAANPSPASPSSPATGTSASVPAGSGTSGSGGTAGSGAASGGLQCSSDGKSFTLGSGSPSQPVAPGTKCVDGAITFAKRSAKFARVNVGGWN